MKLVETHSIEAIKSGLDTKINVFELPTGEFEAHVLRRRAGEVDWTLQWRSARVPRSWRALALARLWHEAHANYFKEACDGDPAQQP